jgi:nucleoid DNA-binding protein
MPKTDRAKFYRLERFEKLRSPFEEPLVGLYSELTTLRELNKRLPKSVIEMQDKDLYKWFREAKDLKGQDRADITRIGNALVQFFLAKPKARKRPRVGFGSTKTGKLFMQLISTIVHPPKFNDFIRNMSLVYQVSIFESFIERVLEIAFWQRPQALIPTQKTVSAEELLESKNIESAKGKLIVKAIESMMQGDIDEIDNQLFRKWKIRLSNFGGWKEFSERFYRRNLIVHTSGRVDLKYRSKTRYKGKAKILTVSERYLLDSIGLFQDMGLSFVEAFHSKLQGT